MEQVNKAKTHLELRLIPNRETETFTVEFKCSDLSQEYAEHLAAHLHDGIEDFMKCVGAVGTRNLGVRNAVTGEEKMLSTEQFGPEQIDPKKVN